MVDLTEIPSAPFDDSRARTVEKVCESAPLYRRYFYSESPNAIKAAVSTVTLFCPVCHHDQPFEIIRDRGYTFRCRACQKHTVIFYLYFGEGDGKNWVMKVGQYPPTTERVPKDVESALSPDDLDLYGKALRSRTFGFGLAGLAYLRRVVENRTNELLDMIVEAATHQSGAADLVRRVAEAKASYQFDQKVELAAQILPASLKPGGLNPLDALHDLASAGIHRLSEEECLDLFDQARIAFEYLFRQLKVDREAAREYVESMHKLQQAREKSLLRKGAPAASAPAEPNDAPSKTAV